MAKQIFSVEDARRYAKRRMPKLMFDFVDGAAGNEGANFRNQLAIDEVLLQPRVLVNVNNRSLKKSFLGREWGLPFGIAPMGMCNLSWPNADKFLAETAVKHNIPVGLATMSSTSIEEAYERAGNNAWFQLYVAQSEELAMELVDRADRAGYDVLVFTVDVPAPAPRLRDLRNGFRVPFRIGSKQFVDFALHPQWSILSLLTGLPKPANIPTSGDKAFDRAGERGGIDWSFLDKLRKRWPRKLVVKGIMSPEDAVRAKAGGVDGIYVSNHGGRQLSSSPASIQMLPTIRQALGDDFPLILDSGIRTGEGVVKALALGADFVMVGRPFLYGVGADGAHGVESILNLIKEDISLTLAQIGRRDVEAVDRSVICNL